jgi:hypothetical protein
MLTKQQTVATGLPVFLRRQTVKGVSQFSCHILEFNPYPANVENRASS